MRGHPSVLATRTVQDGVSRRPLLDSSQNNDFSDRSSLLKSAGEKLSQILKERREKYEEADTIVDVTRPQKQSQEDLANDLHESIPIEEIVRNILIGANKLMITKMKQDAKNLEVK